MEDLVPFQVQLERRQHTRLRALAESSRRSMGSMIRESVANYLATAEEDPLLSLVGAFEDTADQAFGDVAVNHDAYLAQIYWEEGHPDGSSE
jgi:hypothetical protein